MGAVLAVFSRSKGVRHRGGVTKYSTFRRGLIDLMKEHSRPGVVFSTMADLYAYPADAPARAETAAIADPYQRVAALEAAMATDFDSHLLIPHLQLHEFEAMLFANPDMFRDHFPDIPKKIDELIDISNSYRSPEEINEGQTTAPSKRIIARIPQYDRLKVSVGPQIAASIGLPVLRAKCPHFDAWVARLEQLAVPPAAV